MADYEPFLNVLPEPILLLFSTLLLLCVVKVEVFCKLDFPLPSNSLTFFFENYVSKIPFHTHTPLPFSFSPF